MIYQRTGKMIRKFVVETIKNLSGELGHYEILNVYNSQCPLPRGYKLKWSDAWCAATVSAVMIINEYYDISECSCSRMLEKAKQKNIWIEDDAYVPTAGDIIMYDWQDSGEGNDIGEPDHVGIVIECDQEFIIVREGNYYGDIRNRTITVNARYIRGYIVPPYNKEEIGSIIDSLYN